MRGVAWEWTGSRSPQLKLHDFEKNGELEVKTGDFGILELGVTIEYAFLGSHPSDHEYVSRVMRRMFLSFVSYFFGRPSEKCYILALVPTQNSSVL